MTPLTAEEIVRNSNHNEIFKAAKMVSTASGCHSGRCPPRRPRQTSTPTVAEDLHGENGSDAESVSFSQTTFESGAKRAEMQSHHARYDLLNDVALRRWAETCAEGCAKYGPDNWKKGFPAEEMIAHLNVHLQQYCAGDASEDHLGHALWNIAALMWYEENLPHLFTGMPCRRDTTHEGLQMRVKRYRRFWEPTEAQQMASKRDKQLHVLQSMRDSLDREIDTLQSSTP